MLGAVVALSMTPVCAQLTGTKTIGVDYPTLTSAVTDLNTQGVGAGGVVIDVPAGYTETLAGKLTLTATGTAANPITIQKSGVGANPVLTSYVGTVATPSVLADGFFVLAGSDWVTIDGIDLQESAANLDVTTQMEFGYGLFKASATDGAQNNTIKNCTITLSNLNNTAWTAPGHNGSTGIAVLNGLYTATGAVTVTAATGSNSNNKFYGNTVQNCNAGVVFIGFGATTGVGPNPDPLTFLGDIGNDVGGAGASTGNIIRNFGGGAATNPATGVFGNNQWGLNVSYNTVDNNTGTNVNHATTLRGMFFNSSSTSASLTCSNNNISIHGGGTTAQVSWIEQTFGGTPAGNTITISNNTLSGDYLTATSGVFYGIYNTAAAATVNIQNNNITGFNYSGAALAGSGTVYMIYCTASNAGTTYNIQNNTVSNISRTGTTGSTTIGIYVSASLSGMAVNVTGNTVSNMSIDGAGSASTMYGIQTSTGTIAVNNNTVTNLQCLKTTGTSALYGIYNISSPTNENYNNNVVNTLIHNGTGITYGIYAFTTTGTRTVSGNVVYNLRTNGTTIAGLNNSSSSPNIFNNKIYDLQSNNSAPIVAGIQLTSVGTSGVANIYNNLIGDLKAPNATTVATPAIRGINLTSTTTTSSINVSHNTVNLSATSIGTCSTAGLFATTSTTATTAALTMRNNILIDNSPTNGGRHVAYWRSSSTLTNYANASNNNLLWGGNASANNLLYYDGTNSSQTLSQFKTFVGPTRESASQRESTAFTSLVGGNAQFLHVNTAVPTFAESGGTPIATITTDFDGDARNGTTPDIGADEFAGTIPTCVLPEASVARQQDCANSQFFLNVTVTDLSGAPGVDVVSDYAGNPGADLGVGLGTYQIGPFPSGTNVQVSLLRNGDASCNVVLGTYTYDCSTFGQNALSFDGVNDGVICGTAPSLDITGTQLTLEAWIYPTAFKTNTFDGNIINKEGGNAGYQIRCGGAGVLQSALGIGTGYITVTSPNNTLTLNTWQHVAVTYDGTTARLYLNGTEVATAAGTAPITTSPNAMRIGDYAVTPGARNFAGKIDEVRVWSVARSAGDIAAFVNQQLCGNEPGLAAYYRLDQGVADENNAAVTTAIDASPNGNTGTLANFTLNGTTSNWVLGKTGMGTCVACAGVPTAGSITGNANACLAANTSLSLTGATFGLGISYQWKYGPVGGPYTNLGTGLSQSTSAIPVGSWEVIVDVTCSTGPNTVTTAPFALVVNPVPTASASAGAACLGQTLNLTGTTDIGTTFNWTGPNSFTSTSQNPSIPSITAAANGTYTFTATQNGCTSPNATVVVNANPSPVVTGTTATPTALCQGETSQLQVSTAGPAAYCTVSHTTGCGNGDEYISNVTFGAINQSSTCAQNGPSQYTDYTSVSAPIAAGSSTAITVGNPNYFSGDQCRVYVDWNQNGLFTDAGEETILSGTTSFTGTVNAPVGAVNGATRMRVRLTYSSGMAPCGTASYGETEDYTVVVSGGGTALTYSWDNAGTLSSSTIDNPVATPVSTTTYTVTVTNAAGCSVTGSATVNVAVVDDGDPCTVDACVNGVATHTYVDTDGDLTCDALDGCPNDPNKIAPGVCGCGTPDVDTDGDLTLDCNDGCPNDPNKIAPGACGCGVADTDSDGDLTADCNDGCPLDPLKTNPGLCGCGVPEGTCNDCEGTPSGPAQPGTSCDDNDACTINDVWSPSCVCAGTFQDSDGDNVCDANDICPGQDDLLDTDGDGVVDCLDNCPTTYGQIGDSCDDGDPNTTGDVVDATCVCAGTVPPCPDNLTVLTLTTDNNPAQTTWEVVPQGGGAPVCSGSGMAANSSFAYNCCLPSGCYSLRVLDSFGDGLTSGSTGGYVLRDANNNRIIDNAGDGAFTFTSQAPDVFCVPIGTDGLTTGTCDVESASPSFVIQAQENLNVSSQYNVTNSTTGYQFWIFNPDGGYSRRVLQTLANPGSSYPTGTAAALRPTYLRLNSLTTNPVPPYVLLNVRVRTQIAGVYGQFGAACRLKVDPPCATTMLTTAGIPLNPAASCGATGVVINGGQLYADVVNGANKYQFEFTRPGYSRLIAVTSRTLTLSTWQTKPLQCGLSYTVRVRVSFDSGSSWCAWGNTCTISTEACPPIVGGHDRVVENTTGSELNVWPNPSRGEQVHLTIDDLGASFETVTVDITDMFGKRVVARTIATQGSSLNSTIDMAGVASGLYVVTVTADMAGVASGLYVVTVTAGEHTFIKRLVIQ